jgi:hypothetical protein
LEGEKAEKDTSEKSVVVAGFIQLIGILAASAMLAAGIICLFIVGLLLFLWIDAVGFVEVARATSPDRKYDAIVVETDGGATTDFGYIIYLLPAKQPYWRFDTLISWLPGHGIAEVGNFYGASRNPNAYGVNLHWEGPRKLAVEYYKCRYGGVMKAVVFEQQPFEILEKHALDPSAPGGGMEYNLLHRTK